MLTGPWGVGKTYYVKNELLPFAENTNIPGRNDQYKGIYVTLNGITSIKDIDQRIALAYYDLFSNKSFKAGATVATAFGNVFNIRLDDVNFTDFLEIEKCLLFIDDVERTMSELTITDIFGYIASQYTEHNNIKCVLICDESKILDLLYLRVSTSYEKVP